MFLLLSSVSFCVYSDADEDLTFDPQGEFIDFTASDRYITLSSFDLNDHDVTFQEILKLNATSIFSKDADLTNGIKAEVRAGGYVKLTVEAYDKDHNKHMIYTSFLDSDSPDNYSTGAPWTENIEIYHGDTDTHKVIAAKTTDIKMMLQAVQHTFSLAKSEYEQHVRKTLSYKRYLDGISDSDRHPRGIKLAALFGAIALTVAVSALIIVGSISIVATGGADAPAILPIMLAVTSSTVTIDGAYLAAAGVTATAAVVGGIIDDDIVFHDEKFTVMNYGQTQPGYYAKVDLHDKVVPAGSYPIQVSLEMLDAKFYGAKVPGLEELTPRLFEMWHNYAPRHVNQLMAHLTWKDSPGVLDEGDRELLTPYGDGTYCSYCIQESDDMLNDRTQGWVKLIVNPSSVEEVQYTFFPGSSRSVDNEPDLKLGDHIIFEVVVPIESQFTLDVNNPGHYPILENFPYTWLAYFSGEALYQCEPSIRPGEWRPWLGYDSQVHGTAMRRYPDGFTPKFRDWHVDTSVSGFLIYRWTAKMTRRMDADRSTYSPVHTWPKQKTLDPITQKTQRNNQKEGLNMELLQAWKNHAAATASEPDFASYNRNDILPGLDPDEFLYLQNSDGTVTDIITLDGEPWKNVPDGEAENPLNDIVTAYKKNRMWHVDDEDYRDVYGENYASNSYEIQDLGTDNLAPNGNATGNSAAPGHVILRLPSFAPGGSTIDMWLDAEAPLDDDKGFYGNIAGTVYPGTWETGVSYLIQGLDSEEARNYAVSFIYEDSFGRRKYFNVFSKDETEDVLQQVRDTGKWLVLVPSQLGYGYYTVNLWFKNDHYADSWTRIGGKELLDISLRFMSVPAGYSGVNARDYPGVALKESPGDGAHIYLEEFLDKESAGYNTWKFHRYGKTQARTYVFHTGDTSTFEVFDGDPHTFSHRGTEWYLSARLQAKWVSDEQLNGSLKFYVDPIMSDGKAREDNRADGSGKKFTHEWNSAGIYQLKAVYKGANSVAHRIIVIDPSSRQNDQKADITKRRLTEQEKRWLQADGVEFGSNHPNLLSIVNVDSIYRYIDGPRMHTGTQVNRFHPGLDYADGYTWRIGPRDSLVNYDINSSYAPTGLSRAISAFKDGADWLPGAFVRHTSEKKVIQDGEETKKISMPDDIDNGSVSVSKFLSLSNNQRSRIISLFDGAPESWQVRLPWISFVTDPNPYGTSDIYSYRTRTNIKVLYNMRAFFDNDTGAFSGNPTDPAGGDYSYSHMVESGLFLHLMTDDIKLKRQFYQDLATGRKIIYNANNFDAHVSNAKDDGTVIATYSTSD